MSGILSKSYQVEGIVLRKKNFLEADKIIEIFTLEKGKIRAVVKGARKPKSKLSGNTELFTHGNFTLAKGKNLDVITSASPSDHFQKALGNLAKTSRFFLISEVFERLLPGEVPNEKIYKETLYVFKTVNKTDKVYIIYEYLYKLVVLLGYGLSLSVCSECHKEIDGLNDKDNALNFITGGILCPTCRLQHKDSLRLPKDIIKLLKYIEKRTIKEYSKISLPDNNHKKLANFVISYLNCICQKECKSSGLIENIEALK